MSLQNKSIKISFKKMFWPQTFILTRSQNLDWCPFD